MSILELYHLVLYITRSWSADADLGGGLIKQRAARAGEGKSGGYRTIIAFRKDDRSFFIYGFAKNELENISASDLRLLKSEARQYLELKESDLRALLREGKMNEVMDDGQDL